MKHLMKQIEAFEAKTHFSELIAAVAHGEEFIITHHGKKVAKLMTFAEEEGDTTCKGSIRVIRKLRVGITSGKKLSVKKMRAEGRK